MIGSGVKRYKEITNKLLKGEKVSIGVFCTGNGDRSSTAHAVLKQVLREKLLRMGISEADFDNRVEIFSFGVGKVNVGGKAATHTEAYVAQRFPSIREHSRKHVTDYMLDKIPKANLLFAVSLSHRGSLAEFFADTTNPARQKIPEVDAFPSAVEILRKTPTLVDFGRKTGWLRPVAAAISDAQNKLYRGSSLKDPWYDFNDADKLGKAAAALESKGNTVEAEQLRAEQARFMALGQRKLDVVIESAKLAAERLLPEKAVKAYLRARSRV